MKQHNTTTSISCCPGTFVFHLFQSIMEVKKKVIFFTGQNCSLKTFLVEFLCLFSVLKNMWVFFNSEVSSGRRLRKIFYFFFKKLGFTLGTTMKNYFKAEHKMIFNRSSVYTISVTIYIGFFSFYYSSAILVHQYLIFLVSHTSRFFRRRAK